MKKELKIEDVMIGDWVDVRNNAAPNTPHLERITPSHFLRDEHWYGVELVPEILEKNGFEIVYDKYKLPNYRIKKDAYTDFYFTVFTGVDGYWNPVGFGVMIGGVPATLDYVHELQHALKLCGIEKQIEL